MKPDASGERHELLERVLTGELPEDAPEVLEWIARDPSVRDELERLLVVRDRFTEAGRFEDEVLLAAGALGEVSGEERLAAAGRFEDEVLEAANAIEEAPGENLVAAFVEARMDEQGRRSGRSRRRRLAGVLAIAAALLLIFWWRDPRPDVPLGGIVVKRVWPTATDKVSRRDLRFNWELEHHVGWEYQVVVNGDGMNEVKSRRDSNQWWEPGETDAWPGHVIWQLLIFDGSGSQPKAGPVSEVYFLD